MILSDEQTKQIINEDGIYDCRLVQQRFANKILRNDVSPLGDVFCFVAPTVIGPMAINKALVVAAELPNTELFGGVCFLRLYATQLGSLISVMTGKECFVDESCIFADGNQTSLSIINKIKDSVLFHIVFALKSDHDMICKLNLDDQKLEEFKFNAIESFNHLTKSIFAETRRDSF